MRRRMLPAMAVVLGLSTLTVGTPAQAGSYLTIEPAVARPGDRVVVSAYCDYTMDPDFRFPSGSPLVGLVEKQNGRQVVRIADSARPGGYRIEMFCLAKETASYPLAVGTVTVQAPPATKRPTPTPTPTPTPPPATRPPATRPPATRPPASPPPVTRVPPKGGVDTGGGGMSGLIASAAPQESSLGLAGAGVVVAGLGLLLVRVLLRRKRDSDA